MRFVYKIRCSIAHSGAQQGQVYEAYADAQEVIEALYPYLEAAVQGYLGVHMLSRS